MVIDFALPDFLLLLQKLHAPWLDATGLWHVLIRFAAVHSGLCPFGTIHVTEESPPSRTIAICLWLRKFGLEHVNLGPCDVRFLHVDTKPHSHRPHIIDVWHLLYGLFTLGLRLYQPRKPDVLARPCSTWFPHVALWPVAIRVPFIHAGLYGG